MLPKVRNKRRTSEQDENEDDTKAFLLNRKISIKEGVDVRRDYQIGEFIGSGKFGDVNRCSEKSTDYELAAKVIPYSCPDEKEAIMNEVEIMRRLRHPRLIQLYDVFIDRDRFTLVMELITGGELFERVIDENFELDEATCEKFMRQILHGVEYIHSQRVIHLDLKPENILCLSKTSFKIKIIDFGLAREVIGGDLRVMFGTPEFVAPEIISYDPVTYAADMWSIGVVCYVLLSGLSPFMGDNEGETLSNIVRCNYTFNYPEFKDISTDAKEFIKCLLNKDPRKRMTATQCLAHPWLKERTRLKRTATVSKKRLRHFVYRRKWQKAVNAIIALQRMGVVLTSTPNKEPEYRKLLQAKSSKTAALIRKSSIRETSISKTPFDNTEQNQSFRTSDEPTLLTSAQKTPIVSSEAHQISVKKPKPQISIHTPTKPDLKPPVLSSAQNQMPHSPSANKPPPPTPLKKGQNNPVELINSRVNLTKNKSLNASDPINVINKVGQSSPSVEQGGSIFPKVGQSSPSVEQGGSIFPKVGHSSPSVEQKRAPPVTLSPNLVAKPETESKSASFAVANKTVVSPPNKKTLASPAKDPAIPSPRKHNLTLPSITTARPSTAPSKASATANTTESAASTSPDQSNIHPPTPILMKMLSLSKSRGSVADRISFFNNSSPKKNT